MTRKMLKKILSEVHTLPMLEQCQVLKARLENWKGKERQTDLQCDSQRPTLTLRELRQRSDHREFAGQLPAPGPDSCWWPETLIFAHVDSSTARVYLACVTDASVTDTFGVSWECSPVFEGSDRKNRSVSQQDSGRGEFLEVSLQQ